MPVQSIDDIRADSQRYTQEADAYLRTRFPDLFGPGQNIGNTGRNDPMDAFRHAYVSGRFAQV